jgi:hypothetical protein
MLANLLCEVQFRSATANKKSAAELLIEARRALSMTWSVRTTIAKRANDSFITAEALGNGKSPPA